MQQLLRVRAGLDDPWAEPDETALAASLARLARIDSRRFISYVLQWLAGQGPSEPRNPLEHRMLRMLHYTLWQRPLPDSEKIEDMRTRIQRNPRLTAEIVEILSFNYDHLDFLDEPVDVGFDSPLDLHCSYTRDQVLAAIDFYKDNRRPDMCEGVLRVADKNLDVLFVTLNKSEKDYSPTTMYHDHAISKVLFHWQSQSTTSADSTTGQRYIHHAETGSRILLFVRQDKRDALGTPPYVFLGTTRYVAHQGSRPMSITWRLDRAMPPELLSEATMVAV